MTYTLLPHCFLPVCKATRATPIPKGASVISDVFAKTSPAIFPPPHFHSLPNMPPCTAENFNFCGGFQKRSDARASHLPGGVAATQTRSNATQGQNWLSFCGRGEMLMAVKDRSRQSNGLR